VRVNVNGGKFLEVNNQAQASRASDFAPWRTRMDIVKDAATEKWKRNPAAAAGENEIVETHKEIGT